MHLRHPDGHVLCFGQVLGSPDSRHRHGHTTHT
jgi:hypothetical protein